MSVVDSDTEYEWLFREEFPAVMRSVFLICHDANRSQDITQDAFVQLLRHWKKVSRYERPGPGYAGWQSDWPCSRCGGSGSDPFSSARSIPPYHPDRSTST